MFTFIGIDSGTGGDGDSCVVVAEGELDHFMVFLTNDDPAVQFPKKTVRLPYLGKLASGETGEIIFVTYDPLHISRYIMIHNEFSRKRAICLAEVEVFPSGT